MASFTTRVELHQASSQDYDNLHAAMAREGFSREIVAADGNWYQLPTAEYDRSAEMTIEQISSSAQTAANSIGKTYGLFITETMTKRLMFGLTTVKTPQGR